MIYLLDLWGYLKTVNKPIVLYGTGNGADKILNRLKNDNVNISGVFSSTGFKKGKMFAGFPVVSYEEIYKKLSDMIILVGFGSNRPEVLDNIKNLMERHEVYVPDVPVYGDEIFDLSFARQHKNEIETAYSLLEDDISRDTYKKIIMFKLTGDPSLLFNCEKDIQETYSLLNLDDNETFMDLGAYTGDTVELFLNNVNNYSKIIAIEPDARNYRKLCENTKNYESCYCINAAISDKNGKILISNQHGRGVNGDKGKILINALTVDYVSQKHPPSFIKIDVEGSEAIAINGGKKTICNLLPKLHIAAYHTSFDIFSIPLMIKKINAEYKIYLRHHTYLPAWDTNYIFI